MIVRINCNKKCERNRSKFVVIDFWNYDKLKQFNWSVSEHEKTYYAVRKCGVKNGRSMHRMIMQPPDDMEIDHKDGRGWNNQEYNLRVCTRLENARNTAKSRIPVPLVPEKKKKFSDGHYALWKSVFEVQE